MSKIGALSVDRQCDIINDYVAMRITRNEALRRLRATGLDDDWIERSMEFADADRCEVNGQFGVGA